MSGRLYVVIAALFGLTGVAAGALGAHGPPGADPRALELARTGSAYALWHALAILAYLSLRGRGGLAPGLFALGVALFSFSLYALALGAPRVVAYVTPVGGMALILGWLAFGVEALRGGFGRLNDP